MSDIIFSTERLNVRQLTLKDLNDFYEMQSNPRVMLYVKPPLTFEKSKAELVKFIAYYSNPDKFYKIWAVTKNTNNQFVGICGIYQNQKSEYEIAYRLTESAWGNKYGSEIAASLVHYSQSKLNLKHLVAYVYKKNIPSVKILEEHMNFVEELILNPKEKIGLKYSIEKR